MEDHDEITKYYLAEAAISERADSLELRFERYKELVLHCSKSGGWNTFSRFLRFTTATAAMQEGVYTRQLSQVHEWIVRGLNDQYAGTQEEIIHVGVVWEFLEDECISTAPQFGEILAGWLGALYYYCFEQSALDDAGSFYLDLAVDLAQTCRTPAHVFLLGRLVTWTVQHAPNEAKRLTAFCELLIDEPNTPSFVCIPLVLTLSSMSGKFSNRSRYEWAVVGLDRFQECLSPQQKLALLNEKSASKSEFDEGLIITELKKLRVETIAGSRTALEQRVREDGRAELIKPLIANAASWGKFSFLSDLYLAWHGIESGQALPAESILWQVPFNEHGYRAMVGPDQHQIARNSSDLHIDLITKQNRFLSTSISIRGLPSNELNIPDRMGVPSADQGPLFEASLINTYLDDSTTSWLNSLTRHISAQALIPAASHPIQAVQMKVLNTTWPLSASFQRPLEDAKLRKVAIWSSDGLLSAQHEIDTITKIFTRNNVEVDVYHASDEKNCMRFVDVYSDSSYDVIWLIGHGEYSHFHPQKALLQVGGREESTGIDNLLSVGLNRDSRRLFVMNVCDGATHSGVGILPRLGFGPALAFPKQATISHKWPVAPIPAAVFGAFLAAALLSNRTYFAAFKEAIGAMINIQSREQAAAKIRADAGVTTELAERVEVFGDELTAFEHYGSASFFE